MARIAWFDDEPFWIEKLRRRLVKEGHIVTTYETVAKAIADIDEIRKADVLVVDLIALGKSAQNNYELYGGLEIMHKLHEGGRVPPTLAFSVVGSQEVLREARKYSSEILEKPATAEELSAAITRLLVNSMPSRTLPS